MDYRVFSTYYQLSLQGKVIELLCKNNHQHPTLVPSIDDNDRITLSCIHPDCSYKKLAGSALYNQLKAQLDLIGA